MKKLHVISHTHWDREWYLTFQQFRLKLVHLVDRLLDILEEDPNFKHFMLDGQTIVLEDYLQIRPEMESVLRHHIQGGRILIGPWHILPDMFLVSPEAHIRNLLQGARTARRFGPKMQVGYIPDPFGHPGQVPQILKGFGLDAAALWRGMSNEPPELWWESPDGTKIFLAYLRDSYSNGANLPVSNPEGFAEQIGPAGDSLAQHSAVDDHLIMLGTDHMEPSPHTSGAITHADEVLPGTVVVHSTLPAYIAEISERVKDLGDSVPTIQGELRACDRMHLLPGVLSTRMWIKQRNHASQTLLEKWAEPFSVFAEHFITDHAAQTRWADRDFQEITSNRVRNLAPVIRQAWRLVMENHPHDSICGCSIDQVHDEMKPRFDQADQIGAEITAQALQTLAQATDTRSDGVFSSVVIYNPHSHPRTDLVEIELNIPEDIAAFELVDADNNPIPHEFLGSGNEELANLLLGVDSLRDTIGFIHDGQVAGSAITRVRLSREGPVVTIEATLAEDGLPNLFEWRQAEAMIARYEADPSVTHFHVIARSPRASVIRFVSPEIRGLGWETVWVRAVNAPETVSTPEVSPWLKPLLPMALKFAQSEWGRKLLARLESGDEAKPPFVIENEYYRVEASRMDGTLTVTDRRTNAVYSGLNRFVDGGDAGDEYNYSPPVHDSTHTPDLVSLKVFREKLVPSLEIAYRLTVPAGLTPDRKFRSVERVHIPIVSRVSLAPGVPRIDVHTEVDNLAGDHRLRVHFPAPVTTQYADHDGHFEIVRRQVGVPDKGEDWVEDPRPEVPQRAFTDFTDGKIGLLIANRGLPEVEVIQVNGIAQTEIALTLLRCVGWLSRDDMATREGHAGPACETPGAQVPGKWGYDYAIIPHAADRLSAYQAAYAFETPLRAVETGLHPGELIRSGSFIAHTPPEFIITAVKEAEDGDGWIVRGYNISSQPINLTLKPLGPFAYACQVNLAEGEIAVLAVGEEGRISMTVSGYEIMSIKFFN